MYLALSGRTPYLPVPYLSTLPFSGQHLRPAQWLLLSRTLTEHLTSIIMGPYLGNQGNLTRCSLPAAYLPY